MRAIGMLLCRLGYHGKWLYAGFVSEYDMEYRGELNYVVACSRCGKRKFWEGE